jgi:hypothetical protein
MGSGIQSLLIIGNVFEDIDLPQGVVINRQRIAAQNDIAIVKVEDRWLGWNGCRKLEAA